MLSVLNRLISMINGVVLFIVISLLMLVFWLCGEDKDDDWPDDYYAP
jgi:hypothetical protein